MAERFLLRMVKSNMVMAKGKMISVAVLGAGNMGTALAQILALLGHRVRLWDYNSDTIEAIKRDGENKFLPGVKLSRLIERWFIAYSTAAQIRAKKLSNSSVVYRFLDISILNYETSFLSPM